MKLSKIKRIDANFAALALLLALLLGAIVAVVLIPNSIALADEELLAQASSDPVVVSPNTPTLGAVAPTTGYTYTGTRTLPGSSTTVSASDLKAVYRLYSLDGFSAQFVISRGTSLTVTSALQTTATANWYTIEYAELGWYAYAKVNSSADIYLELYTKSYSNGNGIIQSEHKPSITGYAYTDMTLELTPPAAPTGYEFAGWFYDAAFTQPYHDTDVILEDASLYAKFTPITYTVTFILDGANLIEKTVTYNTVVTTVAAAERTGFEFSGWCTNSACTTGYNFETPVTSNLTLYGKYNVKMCTVTFMVNTEVYATVSVPYGTQIIVDGEATGSAAEIMATLEMPALLAAYGNDLTVTGDMDITAEISSSLLKWNSFGLWIANNWIWIVCVLVAVIVGIIVAVKIWR